MSSSTETAVKSKSSEILNIENVDLLELNSQEMNSMMMSWLLSDQLLPVLKPLIQAYQCVIIAIMGNNLVLRKIFVQTTILQTVKSSLMIMVENKSVFNTCSISNICIDSNLYLSVKMLAHYTLLSSVSFLYLYNTVFELLNFKP